MYCVSVTGHNILETVLKRAYFMTGLTVCSTGDVRAINRRETRFNRHASSGPHKKKILVLQLYCCILLGS